MAEERGVAGGRVFTLLDALPDDGERRLMLAVLLDAVRILRKLRPQGPKARRRHAWLRERRWIEAEDRLTPCSFVNVCDALGLDPAYVRRWALRPTAGEGIRLRHPTVYSRHRARRAS
jgi:hypothetical protein